MRWLAMLGDMGYTFLLWLNKWYNLMRARHGKPYYSLSQEVKHRVKSAVSYISDFERELAQGFEERKTFDVADSSADFGYENVNALARRIHARLDFVGNVRNDLNGLTQIVAAAFLLEDVLVNLPRS